MILGDLKIGIAITGSFCTIDKVLIQIQKLVDSKADVSPIISEVVNQTDTRFGTAQSLKEKLKGITGKVPICSIVAAEPIGPQRLFDIIVVAPCTGNSIAKMASGITDTAVTMACKAHLRNQRPVVISVATNDGLGQNAKNIGMLLNTKNVFIVPFGQDDPKQKPKSLVSNTEMIIPTIMEAINGRQFQPVLIPII